MRIKPVQLFAAALGLVASAHAVAPFATATFEKRIEGTDKTTPIASARLDDHVCIRIRDVSTPDGDHSLKLVIYDGGGREVHQSVHTITAKNEKWAYKLCSDFNAGRDLPGTWWYVAELDDVPLVSKELTVSPVQAVSAG
jgi:hypothetical protein